jgi:aminoglycoside phosphotransferase (APT) family kinase protein
VGASGSSDPTAIATRLALGIGPAITGVDPDGLRRWMVANGLAPVGGLTLERIGLGQSNLTYRVRDATERRWVLRRPPLGELLESAHDVVREARILSALEPTPVPVPRVRGVLPPGTVDAAAPAVVMSWVDGAVIDRPAVAAAMPPACRRTAALSLARALAAIHGVDLGSTGLADLTVHSPYATRQLKRWSRQWQRSRTRELPALDALTGRLRAAVRPQCGTTLVHGDLHLRNVILEQGSGDVAAVLDWELSTLGEPLADLGTLLAYWPAAGEPSIDAFAPSKLPGFPDRSEIVAEYRRASARDAAADAAAVAYWHALGLWKLAIIGEGVLRRALDEPLNKAAEGTPTRERIEALVDHAHAIATAAGI